MAAEAQTQQPGTAAVETREVDDFSAILKQSFKPKTERAATEVENAVATLVNQGDSKEDVRISTDSGSETVTVKPSESVQLGTPDGQTVLFEGLGAKPGSLAYVTFQTSTVTETLNVPVLDGGLPQYRDLVP